MTMKADSVKPDGDPATGALRMQLATLKLPYLLELSASATTVGFDSGLWPGYAVM
jgi:hypothetical protein